MNSQRTWTTKDGKKIRVSDMETSHIENALRMLRRKGCISPRIIDSYLGSEPNGDAALDAYHAELSEIMSHPTSEFIDYFEEELKLRASKTPPARAGRNS